MSEVAEYLDRFSTTTAGRLITYLHRFMLNGTQGAESGLRENGAIKAAITECHVYYKSFLVIDAILTFNTYLACKLHKEKKFENFIPLSPRCEILLKDECPAYLDVFEEYIASFADKWLDGSIHREFFFREILEAFSIVVTYILACTNVDLKSIPEARFAYTYLLRDLRSMAIIADAAGRQPFVKQMLENYGKVKSVLITEIGKLKDRENAMLNEIGTTKYRSRQWPFRKMLRWHADFARDKGEQMSRRPEDQRPIHVPHDARYGEIANAMWIWAAMPPSVPRFIQGCKLIENAALLAAKGAPDFNFSNRDFIAVMLSALNEHPKLEGASSMREAAFTEVEKDDMSAALKDMTEALLRLRDCLRSPIGYGEADIDECDDFIAHLPKVLGGITDFKAALFGGEKPVQGGFNAVLFIDLAQGALKFDYEWPFGDKLFDDASALNAELLRACRGGKKSELDAVYAAIVEKYFHKDTTRKTTSVKKKATPREAALALPEAKPEPAEIRPEEKATGRFYIGPKMKRIVDAQHRGAPYYLAAYEGLTAPKSVKYIRELINAIGTDKKPDDPYGGWRKLDANWRMFFKDGPYKRFKLEQLQIGTKNDHSGMCRIIPDNYFDQLTKATKPTPEGT